MALFRRSSAGNTGGEDDPVELPPGSRVVECPRCYADVQQRFVHPGGHHKLSDDDGVVYCD